MKTIYKYDIGSPEIAIKTIKLPHYAKVLHFGIDPKNLESLWIWCEVDTELPVYDREFILIGTGWNIQDAIGEHDFYSTVYIGTVISQIGLVWHLYEIEEGKNYN
jgi:hypothetical protein